MNGKVEIHLRVAEELAERVDSVRGDVPRSKWIERAIEARLEPAPVLIMPEKDYEEAVRRGESVFPGKFIPRGCIQPGVVARFEEPKEDGEDA